MLPFQPSVDRRGRDRGRRGDSSIWLANHWTHGRLLSKNSLLQAVECPIRAVAVNVRDGRPAPRSGRAWVSVQVTKSWFLP